MRRREFISLFVSTVFASPLTARAQHSAMPIIGFLQSASHDYLTKMAKFDLVISLKTAKALNLTVPAPLLALADEVME